MSTSFGNAIRLERSHHVKALLRQRCDPNADGEQLFELPLQQAAASEHGTALDIVKMLLAAHASVNATGACGARKSPLALAARNGHEQIVAHLLASGADVHADDTSCNQPLHEAAASGSVAACRLLIEHGADVNAVGHQGTPLMVAASSSRSNTIYELAGRGANLEATTPDAWRWTPLHTAVVNDRFSAVKALLECHAKVDSVAGDGSTPLHIAAALSRTRIAAFLIQHGADKYARAVRSIERERERPRVLTCRLQP
mgnify:CR=1 FL=1